MRYDAIVVGLGPAGAMASLELASKGANVIGLDKEGFPRYKPCGGCISTKVERVLNTDISEVIEDTVYGATFTYKSGRRLDIISDKPVGYNVMRDRFDSLLVQRARSAGAAIVEKKKVSGIKENGDRVEVICADGDVLSARFVIGADGAGGFVGRDYFSMKPKECAVSITAEVPYERERLPEARQRLYIDFGSVPHGYGWIFPKEKFLSVGMAGDSAKVRGDIKKFFNSFVQSHYIIKDFDVTERVGWTVPIFYDKMPGVARGRVIVAGDTGHLVDPFLGEGIYYAIKTGIAAGRAVCDALNLGRDSLSEYQEWIEEEIYPEFRAAMKLSGLIYNHPRLWYSILEKDTEIMQRYYDVIRGVEDCGSFYSWVYSKIRSKPWKLVRRWVESRMLQS
jgi:geranylgeranyl reductase family protein